MADEEPEDAEVDDLLKPVNRLEEKWRLLVDFMRTRGIAQQHIDSFDYFVNTDIKNIVRANSVVRCEADPSWFVRYTDVKVGQPEAEGEMGGISMPVTPQQCRLRDLTYSAPILVDVEYSRGGQLHRQTGVRIGRLPIMLRSCKCVLSGKSPKELAGLRECLYDPGGYFIVRGIERVCLMQEQQARNRMLLERDRSGLLTCFVVSHTHESKNKTSVSLKNDALYIRHNNLSEAVPIAVVFKAMNVECDQEIAQLIGVEEQFARIVYRSLIEAHTLNVLTQEQALEYLSRKLKSYSSGEFDAEKRAARYTGGQGGFLTKTNKIEQARETLYKVILAHIPLRNWNFRPKAFYLATMCRRVIRASLGELALDDRDFYGNKRIDLAGSLIALLFEDLFKRFNDELRRIADSLIPKQRTQQFDIVRHVREDVITNGLRNALSTGNFFLKRFKFERAGVTKVLNRLSYIAALGMLTHVDSMFEKSRKVSGPRSLHASQWGMMCPSDTPEGESCGLTKNLALLARITTDSDEQPLVRACFAFGTVDVATLSGEELAAGSFFVVFVNGKLVGLTDAPERLVRLVRALRRRGFLEPTVSICSSTLHRAVYLSTDGGRVCRPYIVVQHGRTALTRAHCDELALRIRTFEDCLRDGLVEFLDCAEENDALIALNEAAIGSNTTHLEIEPFTILGVCAGLIPYPHHNQSPRNTYQCAMGKQAMGTIAYNQLNRFETVMYLLAYSQVPLVRTRTIDLTNYHRLPAGHNAIVAVMSYSCYDIEDASIMNKASIERGFGRCLVYRKYDDELKSYAGLRAHDIVVGPQRDAVTGQLRNTHEALDPADGICQPGERVDNRHVLINKMVPKASPAEIAVSVPSSSAPQTSPTTQYEARPLTYKAIEPAYVDKVLITESRDGEQLIKVNIRQTRVPELGDKFSSRHGQKGVIGLIVPQENLPFTDEGIVPDMIMNPHGFPSRMTVGKLIELVGSKAGALHGKFHYGTAFSGDPIEQLSTELRDKGYNYLGKDYITSGVTGEPLQAYIFIGPIYYQKLKHMVLDKVHARARGPRAMLTRQPTEGRARDGGLRLGEMERDCLIAYGASMLLLERLMISSDETDVYVCDHCGHIVSLLDPPRCKLCASTKNIVKLKMPYGAKLLFQELQAMNIVPRLKTKPCIG